MRDYNEELYSNKSNIIIQNYAWALKEKQLKIMELLCSCYMTNYYDADKNTITVSLADLMREVGSSTQSVGGWGYKSFESAIKTLSDTSIIGIGFNGKRRIIRLINTVDFPTLEGETDIICHMSDDFKECMKLQDRGNTKIEFKTIYSMNSRFSIKLYNLLRSWQGKDEVYFDLDYLKELLNVTAKSYSNYAKFRQAVLDVAVDEINEKTNLEITYKGLASAHGRSRKITRVVFNIKNTGDVKALIAPAAEAPASDRLGEEEYDATDKRLLSVIPEECHSKLPTIRQLVVDCLKGGNKIIFNVEERDNILCDILHKFNAVYKTAQAEGLINKSAGGWYVTVLEKYIENGKFNMIINEPTLPDEKEVSFDVALAERQAREGRIDFGSKKNKRRRKE